MFALENGPLRMIEGMVFYLHFPKPSFHTASRGKPTVCYQANRSEIRCLTFGCFANKCGLMRLSHNTLLRKF
jgi:hypothetical protein